MITIANLTKRFGKFLAVEDVSFDVAANQAVALWGPNGAGKTTIIKCLLGLLSYKGQIVLDGLDARWQGKAARRLLGYVPQELAFYDDMTALAMVLFFGRIKQAPAQQAEEVLATVGLTEHAHKPVSALSGGMKQRLALGLALLADPPVLVLDEPTSNLDAASRDGFIDLLKAVKSGGKTVVFTSHRPDEILALADQVVVIDGGKLVLTCPASDLAARMGLRRQVKLHVPLDRLSEAIGVLQAGGFSAHRNGTGLLVDVPADGKARPIHLLSQVNIEVFDFEVT